VTQSVTTGGNELANDAAIVDVNPDVTYVKGPDLHRFHSGAGQPDADRLRMAAVNADANALVTELIAFVDDHPQDSGGPAAGSDRQFGAVRPDGEHAALASGQCFVIAVQESFQMWGWDDRPGSAGSWRLSQHDEATASTAKIIPLRPWFDPPLRAPKIARQIADEKVPAKPERCQAVARTAEPHRSSHSGGRGQD
jgi:hypothetical protein